MNTFINLILPLATIGFCSFLLWKVIYAVYTSYKESTDLTAVLEEAKARAKKSYTPPKF